MYSMNGSRMSGTRLIACVSLVAASMYAGQASADTIFTVNGVAVDSAVVDIYFEGRLGDGRPSSSATPEERIALMGELKDIYLLATQDNVEELAKDPVVAAQIELQRHAILAQTAASNYYTTVSASEEEILAVYDEQVQMAPPLQFKARHILVATQGEATDLISQLDGGADFVALATEKSTGPSGPNGGDLGWFSPNQMVAPFSAAIATIEDGEYTSAPVQTDFGWHVILREDSRETEAPTFESVRESIEQVVVQDKFQAYLETLREADSSKAAESE
jgi:peptidyl-prolyl cis-trans isomerase C